MINYGKELILDIHQCNSSKFNRKDLRKYFKQLCKLIDMRAEKLVFWDDEKVPDEFKQTELHTKGTSAVQFILTSNITIHTLDELKSIYVNIFSCKDFDSKIAEDFTLNFFSGKIIQSKTIERI
jgi:S-adenosylmethionine/arginine decarboxylase-like enzyme